MSRSGWLRRSRDRAGSQAGPSAIRVRTPGDFIALVPYLLGFHPAESVVAVFLRQGTVQLTARLDLPPASAAESLASELDRLRERTESTEQLLIGYSANEAARSLLSRLADRAGPETLDVLFVGPQRWWSLLCGAGCCPAAGTPYDLTSHPVAAQAVLAGLSASTDRSAIEVMVEGPPPADQAVLDLLIEEHVSDVVRWDEGLRKRRMAELVRAWIAAEDCPPDEDCTLLAVLGLDLLARDVAWAMITRTDAHDHVRLWQRVVARAPDDVSSAPLCLLAIAAWVSGNGALMNCCIERLEILDPGYSMLEICRDISARALPPSFWDVLSADLRSHPDLLAG